MPPFSTTSDYQHSADALACSKDDRSDHLLLLVDGVDAGTIRWYPPLSKLGRLAVLPPYRKSGCGARLVQALHELVESGTSRHKAVELEGRPGTVLCVANSQAHAVNFYAKQGYEAEGEEFDEVSGYGSICLTADCSVWLSSVKQDDERGADCATASRDVLWRRQDGQPHRRMVKVLTLRQ